MSRVRVRLEQYKAEIEEKSQYKHEFLGSAPYIVNTLLDDLEQDEKENGWILLSVRDYQKIIRRFLYHARPARERHSFALGVV